MEKSATRFFYTKCFKFHSYLQENCIETTRDWFKTCFGLLPYAGNFSHNKKYAKTEWLCQCKQEKEEEGHILSGKCNVYSDLISQFGDLAEDKNLVQFFQAVLDRREELEEEDRRQQSLTAAVIA